MRLSVLSSPCRLDRRPQPPHEHPAHPPGCPARRRSGTRRAPAAARSAPPATISAFLTGKDVRRLGLPLTRTHFIWSDDLPAHRNDCSAMAAGCRCPRRCRASHRAVQQRPEERGIPGSTTTCAIACGLCCATNSFSVWEKAVHGGSTAVGWAKQLARHRGDLIGAGAHGVVSAVRRGPRPPRTCSRPTARPPPMCARSSGRPVGERPSPGSGACDGHAAVRGARCPCGERTWSEWVELAISLGHRRPAAAPGPADPHDRRSAAGRARGVEARVADGAFCPAQVCATTRIGGSPPLSTTVLQASPYELVGARRCDDICRPERFALQIRGSMTPPTRWPARRVDAPAVRRQHRAGHPQAAARAAADHTTRRRVPAP